MDKPFWNSNVFRVVLLFQFLPAVMLYALGSIDNPQSDLLMAYLRGGVFIYLGRDLGTKGVNAWQSRGKE